MDRRQFLQTTVAGTALGIASSGEPNDIPQLRKMTPANLLVGSAVSYRELQDVAFTALLAEQANIVVPENEMKWAVIHPEPDRFDFTRGDASVSFAKEHGQKVRGHNLCWHEQLPKWFAGYASPQNAADLLRQHIAEVAGHYRGQIQSWDVVNEAINVDDGRPDGLRNSPWLKLVGPDYIVIAFRAARQADPRAILTYNDYGIEQDGPKFDAKRKAVLGMVTALLDQNAPVQAVGLQSHLKAGTKPMNWTALHAFMNAIEKLGLQIFVTELDVDDSDVPGNVNEHDAVVANVYGDYLRNVLQHKSVKAVLTWGLTDRDTWLNSPGLRGNGPLRRPLPFDSDLKPKPAFYAILDAISGAEARKI